jgi:tape measure domain-containing protein
MAIGTTLKIGFDGSEVQRGFAKMKAGALNIGSSIAGMGIATITTAIAAAGAAMVAFGVSSAKSAMEMEDLETQFGVLLKSTDQAKQMMSEFRKEAIKSPLSIEDYAKAGKTILAFGVSQEKVMPSLKMLGDVSMGNADRFQSLALAFAQTQAAGRLMGQEVLQFVNAGFNPLQVISEKTGRSMKDLKKDMEDGAISADMVSEAFKIATSEGGLFYGALEKGSQTTSGKFAKLTDQFSQLKVAFGTGLNEGLGVVYELLGGVMGKFTETFTLAGKAIGAVIAEAVENDTTRLEAIGFYIGTLIKDGITSALQAAGENLAVEMAKNFETYTPAGILSKKLGLNLSGNIESGQKNFSGYWAENKSQREGLLTGIKSSVAVDDSKKIYAESQAEIVAAATKRIQEIKADPFAVADADKEIAKILKEIEKNTSEGAKM